jgi:LruC domain-containing protein
MSIGFSGRSVFALLLMLCPSIALAQDTDGDGVADVADAEPTNPAVAAEAFAPAESRHGMLMFEDMFPFSGDLDFNDVVLGYNLRFALDSARRMVSMRISLSPIAVGGTFDNGLGLRLPVPASALGSASIRVGFGAPVPLVARPDSRLTLTLVQNLRVAFGDLSGPINATGDSAALRGETLEVEINFASPIGLAVGTAPYDLFVFRSSDPTHEIHLPPHGGTRLMRSSLFGSGDDGSGRGRWFVDRQGLPWALLLPVVAEYPRESTEISTLFPDIMEFARSGGTRARNFYESRVVPGRAFRDALGKAAPAPMTRAQHLFERETFGGNGRTCVTCHPRDTGTLSPAAVDARYLANPSDPLFLHDGSDDSASTFSRLRTQATIRVELPLPANVGIEGTAARTVVVHRGVPSTINQPGFGAPLTWDGRATTLQARALAAILDHAQAPTPPSEAALLLLVDFERRMPSFSSSPALLAYARGGAPPQLPRGRTVAERRGRLFFAPGGACASCHGGPLLDTPATQDRFRSVMVSELNVARNPTHRFTIVLPDGSFERIQSPDPGLGLLSGRPEDFNRFKVPTLWGISRTAPYFHDNSAATLEAVVAHYVFYLQARVARGEPAVSLSARDQADILAFLRIL